MSNPFMTPLPRRVRSNPLGGNASGVTSVTRGVPLESRYALFIWAAPNGPLFGNLQPPLGCRTGPPTRDHRWVPQVIGCPGVLLPREFRGRLWPILTFDSDRGSLARRLKSAVRHGG